MVLSWSLQNMLETPFPSFISKKNGWNSDIWNFFLAKIQFCPIFPWKSAFSGRPCLKTSLWRHTLADFQNVGINGKGRPSPLLWYHTLILWACQSQVHKGVVTTPLGRCVTENTLGRRGSKCMVPASDKRAWMTYWLFVSYILLSWASGMCLAGLISKQPKWWHDTLPHFKSLASDHTSGFSLVLSIVWILISPETLICSVFHQKLIIWEYIFLVSNAADNFPIMSVFIRGEGHIRYKTVYHHEDSNVFLSTQLPTNNFAGLVMSCWN